MTRLAFLVIVVLVAIAAPRAAADPTSTVPRDLSGQRAATSGGPLPGAPNTPIVEVRGRVRLGAESMASGAPTSSPAVALEATSGGPSGLTTPMPATLLRGVALDAVARQGIWAYADPSHGSGYLAIPEGPGWLVDVCGPAACLTRVSTDAGPVKSLQRAGRLGDLSAVMFEAVCAMTPAQRVAIGLCPGSLTILRRPSIRLPSTDTAPERTLWDWLRVVA